MILDYSVIMRLGEPMTQNNKTVILEKQARQSILMGLLKDQSTITETNFVSLNVFLNTLIKDERNEDWFKCVALLEKEAHKFETLEEILKFPITTDHILSFLNTMMDEGWELDDLPTLTQKDADLKDVLSFLYPIFNRKKQQWGAFSDVVGESDVKVYDNFYPYPVYKRIKEHTGKGLQLIELPRKIPKIRIYSASNPRSEAQACVQHMLESDVPYDDQVIVCLDTTLQNQVESFLIQYGIPYFRTNEYKTNSSFRLIQDLLQLKLVNNSKNLLRLIQNDKITLENRLELIIYIETFGLELKDVLFPLCHVQKALDGSTLKEVIRFDDYYQLEKKAEISLLNLRPKLKQLNDIEIDDFKIFSSNLFDLYVSFFIEFTDEEVESINKVKFTLEAGVKYLDSMENPIPVLLYKLSLLTLTTKQTSGVILTDLKHSFVFDKKRIYLLSSTQDFYPQLPSSNGLFDDDYMRAISPNDQQKRFDYHMQQLEKIRFSADEVIYSYPIGSYEGKAKKLPYELEIYFKENNLNTSPWKIVEIENKKENQNLKLESDVANLLFFSDNELKGSISTFEKFYRCPYQYFLSAGMKLYEPVNYGINNAMMGTLLHLVLETGIKKHSKRYAEILINHEDELLKPYFDDLSRLFISHQNELSIMHQRTALLLRLSLDFLSGRETSSVFNQYEVEKEFNEIVDVGSEKMLHLRGIIDRIDYNSEGFLIIDYKSSTKSLSESQVMEGLQLQLLTYLWIGEKRFGLKTPNGAYYFSLGQTNAGLPALKMYKKPARVTDASTEEAEWLKKRKFKGWPFQEIESFDNPNGHFVKPQSKALYDREKVEKHLSNRYLYLIQQLEDGNIDKRNIVNSCTYCAFKHFCQYDGEAIKLERIYPKNSTLLGANGEENDDSME